MAFKLKRDANGNVVAVGDKPIVINDADGTETVFDIEGTVAAVKERNAEIVTHRTAADTLRSQLKAYEGLDPAAARKAMETITGIDQKKLIDAGQVDQVVGGLKQTHAAELAKLQEGNAKLMQRFKDAQLNSAFGNSAFLAGKTAPNLQPLIRTFFEKRFSVDDDGNVIALDDTGKPMLSSANPGKNASFDEAIELFIGKAPFRDDVLIGSQKSGGGAQSHGKGGGNGYMTRRQLEALPPSEQYEASQKNTITD